MASLASQQAAAALYYAVLGKNASQSTYDYFGQYLQTGQATAAQLVNVFLTGSDGQARFATKTQAEILTQIYTNIFGTAPTSAQLTDLLNVGSTTTAVSQLVTNLLNYQGFDATTLAQQATFENTINTVLYPVAQSSAAAGASAVEAIYYVIGVDAAQSGINYWGTQMANGANLANVAQVFVNDRAYLTSLNNTDFVARLFESAFLRAPTSSESSTYVALLDGGATRGTVIVDIINLIKGTVASGDLAAQQQFNLATQVYSPGQLPGLSFQEQVASIYLAVPNRGIDSQALDTFSKQLASGTTFSKLLTTLLATNEFQAKGAALSGSAFVTKVFTDVWGSAPTPTQLATYTALGNNTAIAQAIINDLRSSTATDNATVSAQHAFEDAIGTSLLYKTNATLSSTAAGGNATGTINTGSSHVLSNAETAVLLNVILNASTASTVNLQFADHLSNLTINGTAASTVNLSANGVNPGVAVSVNNGNVILNASSGNDVVNVTSTANIATGTANFNLGAGNDALKWAGNAAANSPNTVSAAIKADGGAGTDSISANFFTKSVVTNQNALGIRTSTISSNANNFSNFEKIDLTGYIGQSTGTLITTPLIGSPTTTPVTTPSHVFDFGLLNGTATVEGTAGGTVTQATTPTNMGSQGFVLNGLTNASVINAAGGAAAALEVNGDATASTTLNFSFVNAATQFGINFDAVSSSNVNAGAIGLTGSALTALNIASGGTGSFANVLSLAGSNSVLTNINVTGDHQLDLTVGSGFTFIHDINASGNSGGLNLTTSNGGTGDGLIVQLLNILPLSALTTSLLTPVLNTLGLNGYQMTVEGSSAGDTLNVAANTTLTGGAGANTYMLQSSTSQAGNTITDFNTAKDKIIDHLSGLTLSNTGTAVADYGTRSADILDGVLGSLLGSLTGGVVGLLGGILGLSTGSLTAKVGVASVAFDNGTNSNYVIIDNNNNHSLDAGDTVIYLTGQSHASLVSDLHYA
ncbi:MULTISPECIES: beta strand repeat-containing protein [Serratia]|uniref:beta strand repeat-containing protein n=1 Tax=Serratia TaxID=613 RepID=UPI0007455A53|nr:MULTISPECIES: hypothetical protein [Serratia]APS35972.1 cell surface protein [Serratia marcescens]MBH2682089.1 DUF4214 domain-containing protein [Serratia marcescens]MBH2706235.1 DUF4214 domain-containing protein [Serratia marcescens]MBH2867344.1 DUF4214 domain-containing protein [Serratia marcescens]MBH3188882.1 DUF4214 domain-containing protein [Serratia marcescens]